MGRGSSGATGSAVTSTTVLQAATVTLQPPSIQDIAQGNVLPKGGVPFDKFQKMSDDEKADVIDDALKTSVPLFLDDSGLQRFAYFTGMSDKPNVVSDNQLDKMSGAEIFRTVHNSYNPSTDVGYSATDICKQISQGSFTMYSDSGGSVHGKAIYFADSLRGSTAYGTGRRSDRTMRAKITGGNGITESRLQNSYQRALRRGDKLAVACSKAGHGSARNLYGLAKGYTHITDDGWSGYAMVLNRKCLTVSDAFKETNKLGSRW